MEAFGGATRMRIDERFGGKKRPHGRSIKKGVRL
jgi:hypothetical protein